MTKKRDLKALVRERMAKTGESYTTALAKVRMQRADSKPREPGCLCHLEEGDSPCPVHGHLEEGDSPCPVHGLDSAVTERMAQLGMELVGPPRKEGDVLVQDARVKLPAAAPFVELKFEVPSDATCEHPGCSAKATNNCHASCCGGETRLCDAHEHREQYRRDILGIPPGEFASADPADVGALWDTPTVSVRGFSQPMPEPLAKVVEEKRVEARAAIAAEGRVDFEKLVQRLPIDAPACSRCGTPMEDGGSVGYFCPKKDCFPSGYGGLRRPMTDEEMRLLYNEGKGLDFPFDTAPKTLTLDVGDLPPEQVETFVARLKTQWKRMVVDNKMVAPEHLAEFEKQAEQLALSAAEDAVRSYGKQLAEISFLANLRALAKQFPVPPRIEGPSPADLWRRLELSDEEKLALAEAEKQQPTCTCPRDGKGCLFHHPKVVVAPEPSDEEKRASIDVAKELVQKRAARHSGGPVRVVVNGKLMEVDGPTMDYRAVLLAAGFDPERVLSVTYHASEGSDRARGGILYPTKAPIEVVAGMVFNVADTSNA